MGLALVPNLVMSIMKLVSKDEVGWKLGDLEAMSMAKAKKLVLDLDQMPTKLHLVVALEAMAKPKEAGSKFGGDVDKI